MTAREPAWLLMLCLAADTLPTVCKGTEFLGVGHEVEGIVSFFSARSAALREPAGDVLSLLYQTQGFAGFHQTQGFTSAPLHT